jgi:hypothetical protein
VSSSVNQNLTYELSENGCSTGRHSFNSFADLCVGLQNNTINNDCALNLRADHFRRNCSGQTFSPFDAPIGDPSQPAYPTDPLDPGQPVNQGAGQASVQISGFRNLHLRLDSSLNAGRVACFVENREFHLELDHPEYANVGAQSRLLELSFKPGRSNRFPTRISIDGRGRNSRLSAQLPGIEESWKPRRESCEVEFRRRGRELEASFDCRLDGRLHGRGQTIRMRASVDCRIER